jgi:glycerol-3-phosphate cytidylyltransferase-like family protein
MQTITLEKLQAKDRVLDSDQILDLFKKTRISHDWSFEGTTPRQTSKLTHCYHRYPAKFIPQLVEKLMDEYLIGFGPFHVNDLFMGSGTTLACAIARGYFASGTDINYSAELIAKAKCTPIEPILLKNKVGKFIEDLNFLEDKTLFASSKYRPQIPKSKVERIEYWFKPNAIEELGIMLSRINHEKDEDVRLFLKCCFSHILKTCSRWLMSSTKPTIDKNKKISKPLIAFKKHIKKMVNGNELFWFVVPENVKRNINKHLIINRQDARRQIVKDNTVDIQITSSPYVTSYEYADLHQLTTIWLEPEVDLKEYKKQFIGTSAKTNGTRILKSQVGRDIENKLQKVDKKMADEVEAFFVDMQECFDETYRILKDGGRCCYVIGNTKLKGVDILNAEVFAESMQYSGLKIDRIIKREIPSKILPSKRDAKTGRFAANDNADTFAYPTEYIVIGRKI